MENDGIKELFKLLGPAQTRVEKPEGEADYQRLTEPALGGGGGQHIEPPSGGGGGMSPWEDSVEKRLDSLDRRLTSIETNVTQIKVDTGVLRADVNHLPSKGFTVTVTLAALTALSLITAIVANLDKLLGN